MLQNMVELYLVEIFLNKVNLVTYFKYRMLSIGLFNFNFYRKFFQKVLFI
jgi:hypothetical protein